MVTPLASCGSTILAEEHPQRSGRRYRVEVIQGAVSETRPDGQAWHIARSDAAAPIVGGLVAFSLGLPPQVGMEAGRSLAGDDHALPPNPYVVLQVGPRSLETYPAHRTLRPVWHYAFALDVRDLGPDTPVIIAAHDADGNASLGQAQLRLSDLIGAGSLNLTNVGSLLNLQISVTPLPDVPPSARYHFAIAPTASISSVSRAADRARGNMGPPALELLNGDVVRVRATGEIRPSCGFFGQNAVAGPGGFPGRWQNYNEREFAGQPHASLVAMCGGEPFLIGNGTTFVVRQPGRLVFGVNDHDPGNNCGAGFQVDVEVNPPDVRQAAADDEYRPPWRR